MTMMTCVTSDILTQCRHGEQQGAQQASGHHSQWAEHRVRVNMRVPGAGRPGHTPGETPMVSHDHLMFVL